MRLGQLSRRLDLKPQEIRYLIRQQFQVEIDPDLNTRLEDEHVNALIAKYPSVESAQADLVAASTSEKPVVSAETKLADSMANNEIQASPETLISTEIKEENDAFIPRPVDPDAELIKAPKIKLDGLKVVGKIDLPQPKVAVETDAENTAQADTPKSFKERRQKNQPVVSEEDEEYSIYKDKKGIYHFSQTQRENRKNSLERIKREQQESSRKKNKAKHYEQTAGAHKKEVESAAKKAKKQADREAKNQPAKPVRKGIWGKFVNWLNG